MDLILAGLIEDSVEKQYHEVTKFKTPNMPVRLERYSSGRLIFKKRCKKAKVREISCQSSMSEHRNPDI